MQITSELCSQQFRVTLLTLAGRSRKPLSLLRPPRPRRNPLSWSSILECWMQTSCKNKRNEHSPAAWRERSVAHHVSLARNLLIVRTRNLGDGFEKGFWRRKSQLVQKIYHSHTPFHYNLDNEYLLILHLLVFDAFMEAFDSIVFAVFQNFRF